MVVFVGMASAAFLVYFIVWANAPHPLHWPPRAGRIGLALVIVYIVAIHILVAIYVVGRAALPGNILYHLSTGYLASTVVAQAVLGVLFGFAFAYWVSQIIPDDTALWAGGRGRFHTRLGYVLLALFVLGIFYEPISELIQRVTGISTPAGSITVAASAGHGPVISSSVAAASTTAPNPTESEALANLEKLAYYDLGCDVSYAQIVDSITAAPPSTDCYSRASPISDPVIEELFLPFAYCTAEMLPDRENIVAIDAALVDANTVFRTLIQTDPASISDAEWKSYASQLMTAYETIYKSANKYVTQYARQTPPAYIPHKKSNYFGRYFCADTMAGVLGERPSMLKDIYKPDSPNYIIASSYFLFMQGRFQIAADQVIDWIVDHSAQAVRRTHPGRDTWPWIRANFALRNMLSGPLNPSSAGPRAVTVENYMAFIRGFLDVYRPLLSWKDSIISKPSSEFARHCDHSSIDEKRLYFAYFGYANAYAYYAATIQKDQKRAVEYAEALRDLAREGLPCFSWLSPEQQTRYRAAFYDTYGFVLLQFALARVPVDSAEDHDIREKLRNARNAFEQALLLAASLVGPDVQSLGKTTLFTPNESNDLVRVINAHLHETMHSLEERG